MGPALAAFLLLAAASPPSARPTGDALSPEHAAAFARIAEIAAFGEKLGLPPTGHFRRAEPEVGAIHILYACPPFELRRHYNETYVLHSTDRAAVDRAAEAARARGEELRIETLDAVADGECPATRALLEASLLRQAYVVLHENAHVALRSDLAIEEPLADAIATIGSEAYFRSKFGPGSVFVAESMRGRGRMDRFLALCEEIYRDLGGLYRAPFTDAAERERRRSEALGRARARFEHVVLEEGLGFRAEELNNAFLTREHTFALHRGLAFAAADAFESPGDAVSVLLAVPEPEEEAVSFLTRIASRAATRPSGRFRSGPAGAGD